MLPGTSLLLFIAAHIHSFDRVLQKELGENVNQSPCLWSHCLVHLLNLLRQKEKSGEGWDEEDRGNEERQREEQR